MSSSRILELSSRIAANTTKLDEYLKSNNIPSPSFDIDGPRDTLVPKHETDVEAARVSIIDDTLELRQLVLGPREYLMSYTHNELISQQAITRFGLARSFPIGSEATFGEIAAATGLSESIVRRIIRHAVIKKIFEEPRLGVVSHNAVSRLLAEDQVINDWVASSCDELWQAASQTCNAMAKFPKSEEPNETGFSLANQTDKSIYEVFAQNPDRAFRFGNAMKSFTEGTGFELSHVVDNFPWGEIGGGTMVDVGGSQGFVCFDIARKFPSMSFVVQDLEPVIAAAQKDVPHDLTDRVKFTVHDFLTEQPVQGADIYFFRWILHNWSDKYAIKILQNLIPALKPGAKVIINDNVLPQPGNLSNWQENRLRSMDLCMTEIQNSRERELVDWKELLTKASPHFEFKWAKQPSGSNLWLIVAEWN